MSLTYTGGAMMSKGAAYRPEPSPYTTYCQPGLMAEREARRILEAKEPLESDDVFVGWVKGEEDIKGAYIEALAAFVGEK